MGPLRLHWYLANVPKYDVLTIESFLSEGLNPWNRPSLRDFMDNSIELTKGRFTLGVKAVKSWGQLNQYMSSFEVRAGLQVLSLLTPRPFVGPPIHEGSFCALGAISRPAFYKFGYAINYWP